MASSSGTDTDASDVVTLFARRRCYRRVRRDLRRRDRRLAVRQLQTLPRQAAQPGRYQLARRGHVRFRLPPRRRGPAGWSTTRDGSVTAGGRPAGYTTSSVMVPVGRDRRSASLRPPWDSLWLLRFSHRHAVHLDQLVDHVRGRRARPGHQRRADAVAVHRFGAATRRWRTRRGRRTPRCGCWWRPAGRAARGPGGPARPSSPESMRTAPSACPGGGHGIGHAGRHVVGVHQQRGVDAQRVDLGAERGQFVVRGPSALVCSMVNACAVVPSAGIPYRRWASRLEDAAKPAI